ncbi:hypothetical protein NM688_g9442 [Phlebia brevispora]|uniref:Uncharacterized protein n=1 Tax=Phlebia brevispora TaxID=194682 RepID=A0ACC1RHK3_9APHY|nr:hypothetical protein NM688_g9442 [Phlebia brevispora]
MSMLSQAGGENDSADFEDEGKDEGEFDEQLPMYPGAADLSYSDEAEAADQDHGGAVEVADIDHGNDAEVANIDRDGAADIDHGNDTQAADINRGGAVEATTANLNNGYGLVPAAGLSHDEVSLDQESNAYFHQEDEVEDGEDDADDDELDETDLTEDDEEVHEATVDYNEYTADAFNLSLWAANHADSLPELPESAPLVVYSSGLVYLTSLEPPTAQDPYYHGEVMTDSGVLESTPADGFEANITYNPAYEGVHRVHDSYATRPAESELSKALGPICAQ